MKKTAAIVLTALFVLASVQAEARSRHHRHHRSARHHVQSRQAPPAAFNRNPLGYGEGGRPAMVGR